MDTQRTDQRLAMSSRHARERVRRADRPKNLLAIELFMGLIALICGGVLLVDGLGMPESTLDRSPFDSFVIPGFLLGGVVGGSMLLAARLIWFRHRMAPIMSLLAGIILLGWILVEALMIRDGRLLQIAVAVYAVVTIAMAWRFRRRGQTSTTAEQARDSPGRRQMRSP